MTKIAYEEWNPGIESMALVVIANLIIEEYMGQGYEITLRQLYYQFVARGHIPNTMREYNRLKRILTLGRLAGLIHWEAIEDRTRNLHRKPHWDDAPHIIEAASQWFEVDMWENQSTYVEVWVEKEALSGVFEPICDEYDVPFFANRGYVSQSEMWSAAQRFNDRYDDGKDIVILHFGDHDPSGLDMTDDILRRMEVFVVPIEVERIALNMDQIDQYGPPPNPAKETDSRHAAYVQEYGHHSWELDALDPSTLRRLVEEEVLRFIDDEQWAEDMERIEMGRSQLRTVSRRWDDVSELLFDDE